MNEEYRLWEKRQIEKGIDIGWVKKEIKSFRVETPSWGYGDSGTRFKTFKEKGAANSIFEKLDDAEQVNKFTGICPSVAIHIPWDKVDNYNEIKLYAETHSLQIGTVNPNLIFADEYQFGSLCNADPSIRKLAVKHMLECVDIAKIVGAKVLSLWLPDGTNYPGQGDFRARKLWLIDCLRELDKAMDDDMRMLIEYKTHEPAFYHTDIADWGMAYSLAEKIGKKAEVLVDLGHHAQGTNIEHIVAFLIDEGKIGGFHFNNRKYADDDLIVGSINPYELFLIFNELIAGKLDPRAARTVNNISYMIDQSHCIEPKIPAMIRSVMNIQTAHAKALLIQRDSLKKAQQCNDVMTAEAIVREAFETDVGPLLRMVREEIGLQPDPMKAYLESNYEKKKQKR